MPPRARRYDLTTTKDALRAQTAAVAGAARAVPEDGLGAPSGLPGWDVHHLLVHIAQQVEAVERLLSEPPPAAVRAEVDLSRWAATTGAIADRLDEDTRSAAEATASAAARLEAAQRGLGEALDAVGPRQLVPHLFGPMTAADFLVTRLVELVVHSDDLSRATGVPVDLDRRALAAVVRVLADALAASAPGGAVELRVPPYAAVQCAPGPRHTRGTPPNVVEAAPLIWVRLATGRLPWPEAPLTASGDRADLSPYLPILT